MTTHLRSLPARHPLWLAAPLLLWWSLRGVPLREVWGTPAGLRLSQVLVLV
jgi:hypothetical protein